MSPRPARSRPASRILLSLGAASAALLLSGCPPAPGPGPTPTPTDATAPPSPTPTGSPTATPSGGPAIPGAWDTLTTADGVCTDSPALVGESFVADGTTLCSPAGTATDPATAPSAWSTITVPVGTTASAAVRFPPGGGLVVATDAGLCVYGVGGPAATWDCRTAADGYPYPDIHDMVNLGIDAGFALPASIAHVPDIFGAPGTEVGLPAVVGDAGAAPTRLTAIETPNDEIWAGTNGFGAVVLDPATGTTTRHTTADGLPSDDVRDLTFGSTDPTLGRGYPIWAATAAGVGRWDGTTWTAFTAADGLASDDVLGIAVDRSGVVWVATAAGPASFDGAAWHAYTAADGTPAADVVDVAVTSWGVWFATAGAGLVVFLPS